MPKNELNLKDRLSRLRIALSKKYLKRYVIHSAIRTLEVRTYFLNRRVFIIGA